jgi:hypothetical protein
MDAVAEFVTARIREEETAAWRDVSCCNRGGWNDRSVIVLEQCEVKRSVVDRYVETRASRDRARFGTFIPSSQSQQFADQCAQAMLAVAATYRDHPRFDRSWLAVRYV